jgi:hypothetical protein
MPARLQVTFTRPPPGGYAPPPPTALVGAVGAPPGAEYGGAEETKHGGGGGSIRVEIIDDGAGAAATAAPAPGARSSVSLPARLSEYFKPDAGGGGGGGGDSVEAAGEDDDNALLLFDETIDANALLPDPADKAEFATYCEMVTAQECLAVMARHAELEAAVEYLSKASRATACGCCTLLGVPPLRRSHRVRR